MRILIKRKQSMMIETKKSESLMVFYWIQTKIQIRMMRIICAIIQLLTVLVEVLDDIKILKSNINHDDDRKTNYSTQTLFL